MTDSEKKIQAAAQSSGGVSPKALEHIIDTAECIHGWLESIDFPEDDYSTHVTKLLLTFEMAFRQIGFDGEQFTALFNKMQAEINEVKPEIEEAA